MDEEIINILCKWNPIGVPQRITRSEYSYLLDGFYKIEPDIVSIERYLINAYENIMGLEINDITRNEIKDVAEKIFQVLSE